MRTLATHRIFGDRDGDGLTANRFSDALGVVPTLSWNAGEVLHQLDRALLTRLLSVPGTLLLDVTDDHPDE